MATRKQFCDAMHEVYKNHGVYIATGNGEYTETLTIGKIHKMEKDYGQNVETNTARVLTFIGDCYRKGYNMVASRAGDCSGIIVGILRDLKLIPSTADYRARDLQSKLTKPVALKNLKAGDLVFDKPVEASHVGVYYGDNMVIDSRGRDKGVLYTSLSSYPWSCGGSFSWWEEPTIEYYPKYKGTSISIVEALKAVGEKDTSFEHRQRIAVANKFVDTIGKWKGTAAQNLQMLKVLKEGNLIKCQ